MQKCPGLWLSDLCLTGTIADDPQRMELDREDAASAAPIGQFGAAQGSLHFAARAVIETGVPNTAPHHPPIPIACHRAFGHQPEVGVRWLAERRVDGCPP